ncbi:unnamed protein product [Arabidopsis thaliana]|uniref:(thale cress) hypothetical protein n=1 Tax=Arabidopsis thaliana TaxID=3702 RepID=A0A7G2ER30_ARATH|nr:unnamed protein product [Arabidopsis thaliana]
MYTRSVVFNFLLALVKVVVYSERQDIDYTYANMLKWHYPGEGGSIAGVALGPVRVTATLEYDGDRFGISTIGPVCETICKVKGSNSTAESVEFFLVLTSWLVFSLINATFVVQILISKIQGRRTAYEDLYSQYMERNEAFP